MRVTGWIKDGHFQIDVDLWPSPSKESTAPAESTAPRPMRKEREKKDHRPAIKTAISELQAKKSKVNLNQVRRHLGWGLLGGGDRRRLQIKEVLAELGIETKYAPRKAVSTPAQTLPVMEIEVRHGDLTCPRDNKEHVMEFCQLPSEGRTPCPYYNGKSVNDGGNGLVSCTYAAAEEVKK